MNIATGIINFVYGYSFETTTGQIKIQYSPEKCDILCMSDIVYIAGEYEGIVAVCKDSTMSIEKTANKYKLNYSVVSPLGSDVGETILKNFEFWFSNDNGFVFRQHESLMPLFMRDIFISRLQYPRVI